MKTRIGMAKTISLSQINRHRYLPQNRSMIPVTAALRSHHAKEHKDAVARQLNHVGPVMSIVKAAAHARATGITEMIDIAMRRRSLG
jgi:hypothetical protein